MSRFRASVKAPSRSAFDNARTYYLRQLEHAALLATKQAARGAVVQMRAEFTGAGLGPNLARAFGSGSDFDKNGDVHRKANGFSASGYVFIRSQSERTRGAIEAYTQGADIRPVKGRFLWIATDEIQARAGLGRKRYRITPALYNAYGLNRKIGPLVRIRSINGNPLLIVRDATVSAAGLKGRARARLKSGRVPRGQREKATIVAFVGIPRTARAARVDILAIAKNWQARVPALMIQQLNRRG